MKKSRKKVPYSQPSKRNPMVDVPTNAARRAKTLESEKAADARLRAALGNPKDVHGKPVPGHIVSTMAASHLVAVPGLNIADDFTYIANTFLAKLRYQHGCIVSVTALWKSFLHLLDSVDTSFAQKIINYEIPFRWYTAGYIAKIASEYDLMPSAIATVEIWEDEKGFRQIAVQRDGTRREIRPEDYFPEPPMLFCPGTTVSEGMAARGSFPSSQKIFYEDSLINVATPEPSEVEEIRKKFSSWSALRSSSQRHKP